MEDSRKTCSILNQHYPSICLLRGKYKKTFAYLTLHERIPIIYSKLIEEILSHKAKIIKRYGEDCRSELYHVLENIKILIDELKSDKLLTKLNGCETDTELWNNFLSSLPINENTYFSTCWLWAECYLYKRLNSIFENTKFLKDFDYFESYKQTALISSVDVISTLTTKLGAIFKTNMNKKNNLKQILYLQLWGNKCDLSLSDGQEVKLFGDQLNLMDKLNSYILVDEADEICSLLLESYLGDRLIDIVCDNAGYELFTDLLFADYLIEKNLASKVRFHTKAIPWFISDTTPNDFHWTLKYLREHELVELSVLGEKWTQFLEQDKFCLLKPDIFWVSPYEFYRMKEISPKLFETLAEAFLIIIKGDLNYRKLLGDFSWPYTENFEVCLRNFHPTYICSLRTIKADLICGLKPGIAELLFKSDPHWMLTGKYATIKLCKKICID